MQENVLPGVKRVILVLSGKGGVGKSTVATQLALCFRHIGKNVGLLDIDLCGPSVPKLLGLSDQIVRQCESGWLPVYTDQTQSLAVMSVGFLLDNSDSAIVWRGPKKAAMIRQFLTDVCWGERDILIIDTPPGTSDEHITVMENLRPILPKVQGAILVTTPQAVAVADVRREVTFCKKANLPILGIVENMSGFRCPNCQHCSNIFSQGGGQQLAEMSKVPFLGCAPVDMQLAVSGETGVDFIQKHSESEAARFFLNLVLRLEATA